MLWGTKVSPSTISELNKKAYVHIENWRNRSLHCGKYPYIYVDGIYLRRNWDKASWTEFFKWLKSHDIAGVRLVLEAVGEVFQEAKYNDAPFISVVIVTAILDKARNGIT